LRQDGSVCIDFACLIADVEGEGEGDALSLSFTNPSHGTLTRTDDGRYLYRPASGFSGTDSFTYTVSDGQASTTATITLDVDRWGHCGSSASVQVTSGWASASQANGGYRYIVVNQGSRSSNPAADRGVEDLPSVDWNAQVEAEMYAASASSQWWNAAFEQSFSSQIDFEQYGLIIKKPH
jgi:hypothetical protein